MTKYTELLGISVGVAIDEETRFADTFAPLTNARLKEIIVVAGGIAATSLIECGYVVVEATSFGGIRGLVPFSGAGLQTAPKAVNSGIFKQEVDLKVNIGVALTIKYYYNVLPTTPELLVFGVFEA